MNDRPSVVLVDDSPEVRLLVKTRLELSGLFGVVADGSNGVEAIGLAYHHQPSLLLLDLSMPTMDGLEALPGILEVAPATRVVIYTGFEERDVLEAARAMGAAGFVEKSLAIERLPDTLLAFVSDDAPSGQVSSQRPRLAVVPESAPPADDGKDQRTLDEHLESFREVFDEAAIGMATMTLSGSVVRANRAMATLMRCEPTDLVGVDYGRLTSGRGAELDTALQQISTGSTDLVQLEHDIAGWPEPLRGRCSLAAVRDHKGKALYVFLQLQDVTAQAAAEEQLRLAEERFRLLVEAVQEYAIFMLDPEGIVVSWNSGAKRIKGYRASEIVGQHFRMFYPEEQQRNRHPEDELRLALKNGRYEEEGWRVRKDGTQFWANVLITAVFNEVGTHLGFAKVTRDATQRRRAEDEQAASTAALATANTELEGLATRFREAADDQARFLAVTAHELRSPVTVLAGTADTLSRHWDRLSDSERGPLLSAMASGADQLQRLFRDLLAASKSDASRMTVERHVVGVRSVLDRALSAIRAAGATDTVVVNADPDLMVMADHDQLVQAVDNLVRNALRHGVPPVHLTAAEADDNVMIRVSDRGTGVDPSLRPRLFSRFASGDPGGSTGLGLFIARSIAQGHGGDASYEPPTDGYPGGVFLLTLPSAQSDAGKQQGATG
jgi:PAS domain S-box-containing protein